MKMRKWFCIGPLLMLTAIVAPTAHADQTYDVTFTCEFCFDAPTAPSVSFTTPPTLDVTMGSFFFDVTLPSDDAPNDSYTWGASATCLPELVPNSCDAGIIQTFSITDTTRNDGSSGQVISFSLGFNESGAVRFTNPSGPTNPVPEPSTLILLLTGVVLFFALRKI